MIARLVEYFGVIGASAGVFYATGYLVLAGHSRVLGLPLRATDTGTLLNSAFEFLLQGTLYSVLRSLQAVIRIATPTVLATTLFVVIAGSIWWRIATHLEHAWRFIARHVSRHQLAWSIVGGLLILSLQVYQVAAHVVPSASVTSLLSAPKPAYPPFPALRPSLRAFFQRHWEEVHRAITGNGVESDAATLSGLYVTHVAVSVITLCAGLWLWPVARRQHRRFPVRLVVASVVGLGGLLCLYTPLYYGATMKSYRYSRVKLTAGELKDGSPMAPAYEAMQRRPLFLLQITDSDYVLYDERFTEIDLVRRDLVGLVTITEDDFLFPSPNAVR